MITELVVFDTDRDADGFTTALDCNDFDDAVNPGAFEICNDGIDNNCNGIIDSDCERLEFRMWDRNRNRNVLRHIP